MKIEEFENIEDKKWSDWFGEGSIKQDFKEIVEKFGNPIKVSVDGYMLCLIYKNKIIIYGYDGNEYHHRFNFKI